MIWNGGRTCARIPSRISYDGFSSLFLHHGAVRIYRHILTNLPGSQETPITEADTCRKYVLPKLYEAGWTDDQISEQKTFTDGRIVVFQNGCKRRQQKRADYILRYRRDYMIGIIEAKAAYRN